MAAFLRVSVLLCSSFLGFLFLALMPAAKAPAGTLSVPGLRNIFLDEREITNSDWAFYIQYLKEKHGADSETYKNALPDSVVWELAYPDNMDYQNYPLTGISFSQAKDFCAWRSAFISEKEKREITFQMPTLREYKLTRPDNENPIAAGLYSTGLGFRGFLGICDNAAEMTATEGIAVSGGSAACLDSLEYFSPQPNLGFRCRAVLK